MAAVEERGGNGPRPREEALYITDG